MGCSRNASMLLSSLLLASACTDRMPLVPTEALNGRTPASPGTLPPPAEPGRYVLGFDGAASIPDAVLAASGGQIVDSIPGFNVLVVDGVTRPDVLRDAGPRYIEAGYDMSVSPILTDDQVPNLEDLPAAVPGAENTPWYASRVQWDMRAMKADDGWAMTDGGAGVNICIVDTGIDDQHQELTGKVSMRANFVTAEPRVDDPNGHGSHVAGEAAAKGVVVNGVAPRATLMGARVLSAAGSGSETAIANGIRWCADNGAHVINMSLGGIRYRGNPGYIESPILYGMAVNYATSRGAVVVISAGNSNIQLPNSSQIVVPAQVAGAIVVGATGPLTKSTAPLPPSWNPFDPSQVWQGPDTKAFYSNFGTAITVFAPGGRGNIPLSSIYRFVNRVQQGTVNDAIWSVCSGNSSQTGAANVGGIPAGSASCLGQSNRYVPYNGTSMAAPHVTGMAAVLYAELGGTRSAANRARVEACITSTADNIGQPAIYGGGRVNVHKAIDAIRAGSC